ncbi:MAG TPA: hypothetical protein VG253_18300 [Streptosporangiaceae bacterium]|jgi:hypothetical protein|nr:hypothetical protein [Streptosporangiaceae bacterium]
MSAHSVIPVDIWVTRQGLVRREQAVLPQPAASPRAPTIALPFTVTFSNFGTAVHVRPPPAAETVSYPQKG